MLTTALKFAALLALALVFPGALLGYLATQPQDDD